MSRILIVDDEPQITRMLRASLVSSGYEVIKAGNGREGLEVFESSKPDLVITDLSMPVMDGLALTEAIRRISRVPIIVLSVRATEGMKIDALDAGADDYVTKPFAMPELLARVRAQLRRQALPPQESTTPEGTLNAGDFELNPEVHRVLVRGVDVRLTPKEFQLLAALLQKPDRILTHRALGRFIWGAAEEGQVEKLRTLVAQLRKKIEHGEHRYIHSEPWVGYRLTPSPENL
ncbi:response regulator transcription factor [Terriglobus aquaticus]|uniref:Response regulator transcription factor n=1 Tax=Terriglobus aquaticus TaxID=940139 RepID=A0ABW9KR21_9BACT|nr:response regulator transcription factor [Terriglobus aquaticus]